VVDFGWLRGSGRVCDQRGRGEATWDQLLGAIPTVASDPTAPPGTSFQYSPLPVTTSHSSQEQVSGAMPQQLSRELGSKMWICALSENC